MKRLEYDSNSCTACKKCETACSTTFFKQDNRELSSIRISVKENNLKEGNVCSQCGECITVCPTQALSFNPRGVVMLNKKLCVSCLSCIGFCPTLSMHLDKSSLIPFKCVACGTCVKSCEAGALKVVEKVEEKV